MEILGHRCHERVYDLLDPLSPDRFDMFHEASADMLEDLCLEYGVKTAVELGCFWGNSTIQIARWLGPRATVYAVDHWRGQDYYGEELQSRDHYRQFLSNVKHAGLERNIVPVRMDTQEAARALDIRPELVYVDAGHSYGECLNDIVAWARKLTGPKLICGDDYNLLEVQAAVQAAAEFLQREVWGNGTAWRII